MPFNGLNNTRGNPTAAIDEVDRFVWANAKDVSGMMKLGAFKGNESVRRKLFNINKKMEVCHG